MIIISQIATDVIIDMPPDPTDPEDMIHAAFFSGQMEEALRQSLHLDCWLSAHFADLMEALELITSGVDDEYVLMLTLFLHDSQSPILGRDFH
jgi:nuclear pore complex protein Nup85